MYSEILREVPSNIPSTLSTSLRSGNTQPSNKGPKISILEETRPPIDDVDAMINENS